MENKRNGVGIAAGILFCIMLVHTLWGTVSWLAGLGEVAALFLFTYVRYRIPEVLGWCASLLTIISLFRNRRSWLLVSAYSISALLMLWDCVTDLISGSYVSLLFVLFYIPAFLKVVMVFFCCVPALQNRARWTGVIWFLPDMLYVLLNSVTMYMQRINYLNQFRYNRMSFALAMLFDFALPTVSSLLLCFWLTKPARTKSVTA